MKSPHYIFSPVLICVCLFMLMNAASVNGQSSERVFTIEEDKEEFEGLIDYLYLLKEPESGMTLEELIQQDEKNRLLPYADFAQPLDRGQFYWGSFKSKCTASKSPSSRNVLE